MSLTLFPFLQRSFVKIVKRGTAIYDIQEAGYNPK